MRSSTIIASSLSVLSSVAAFQVPSSKYAPFLPSHGDIDIDDEVLLSNGTSLASDGDELRKRQARQGNCPSNYNSCSTFAAIYSAACCTRSSVCTIDGNSNVACCPTGATCTGTIAANTAATATTGFASASATATVTATYVVNEFFPFPYIPTTYVNSAACTSAYSACQTNYALCTQGLNGGGFGVTISAVGGGVTVAPSATDVGFASATSICSSLSAEACRGLETSLCAQYGTGAGTLTTTTSGNSVFIVGTTNAAPARPTLGNMVAAAGVVAAAGLGIAGQMV